MKKEVIEIKTIKEPPYKLTDEGLEIWNKFWQSKPSDLDLLSIDYFMLSAYCEEMALYYRCRKVINRTGLFYTTEKGYEVQRIEVSVGNTSLSSANTIAAKLGLTPDARKKLGISQKKQPSKKDPFAETA